MGKATHEEWRKWIDAELERLATPQTEWWKQREHKKRLQEITPFKRAGEK